MTKILIEKVDNGYVIKDLSGDTKRIEVIQEDDMDKYGELKAYRILTYTLMEFFGIMSSRKGAHLNVEILDEDKIIED